MPFVYSTLTNHVIYTRTRIVHDSKAMPIVEGQVEIFGGTGVSTKQLLTPRGIRTEVTQEQLDQILTPNLVFQQHLKEGFITVDNDPKIEASAMAKNMEIDEASSPLTPEDYKDKRLKPKVNKVDLIKPI